MSCTQELNRGIACPNDEGPTVAAVAPRESDHDAKHDCRQAASHGQDRFAIDKAAKAHHG